MCLECRHRHNAAEVVNAVSTLRDAGIDNISIDLIYGFPGESLKQWDDDITAALSLGVEHISAYCLSYEEGTPLYRMLKEGKVEESDDELTRAMYYRLIDRLATAGTFFLIDIRNIILHMDCIGWTILFAQMTCNTANGAGVHDILSLISGIALYQMHCLIRNKLNQVLRACSHTFSTGFTLFLINLCNTIHDMNSIKRTSLYTGSVTKTSIITGLWPAIGHERHSGAYDEEIGRAHV